MKRKPELVKWMEVNCYGMDVNEAISAIDRVYFSCIVWDIEKEEWELMSTSARQVWVSQVLSSI